MIGILGGMGTKAGLDFCDKLAILSKGKTDQKYPLFLLFNKSNIPGRTESISLAATSSSNSFGKPKNLNTYNKVLKSLIEGCLLLQKNKCRFIAVPCNTAHYWYDDLQRKIKIPIINMPKEVFLYTKKNCKDKSKIGILATEGTLKTKIYNNFFDKNFLLIKPKKILQLRSVNKTIKYIKMGKIKEAGKAIQPAINYLIKMRCKKIILGCTELPIAVFSLKSFKNKNLSRIFIDSNSILASVSMKKNS
jgi:aspartate racemase